MIDVNINPWGVVPGDVVTAEDFSGVYRVDEVKTSVVDGVTVYTAKLIQVFTIDGKPVKLNRPAYSELRKLKPAFFLLNSLNERILHLQNLAGYLNRIKESNKL